MHSELPGENFKMEKLESCKNRVLKNHDGVSRYKGVMSCK